MNEDNIVEYMNDNWEHVKDTLDTDNPSIKEQVDNIDALKWILAQGKDK